MTITATTTTGHGAILSGWYLLRAPEQVAAGDRYWRETALVGWKEGYWLPVTHGNLELVRASGAAVIRKGNGGPV